VNRACRLYGRETWSPHSPLCLAHRPSPEERAKWATKSRTAKGYGEAHKAMRKRYAAIVASGLAVCARCGRPIMPGTPWDLRHVEARSIVHATAKPAERKEPSSRTLAPVLIIRSSPPSAAGPETGMRPTPCRTTPSS
jgi:hypothetical protein